MRFEIWERSLRTGWRRCLLFRADPSGGVTIVPDGEECVSFPWEQVRRVYLSRQLPRRVRLVVMTETGTHAATVCAHADAHRMPALRCRFAMIDDETTPRYSEMEPVWAHVRDDRILTQIRSVRPTP